MVTWDWNILLTPGLRQQFPDSCGPHGGKEGPSVHTAEVRQVPVEVELVCYHCQASVLKGYQKGMSS